MSIRRSGAAGVKRNRYRPRLHGRGLEPCTRGAGCAPACAKDGRDLRPRRSLAHACHRNRGCGLFFEKVQGSLRRRRLSSGRCPGHPLWVPELPRHRQADGQRRRPACTTSARPSAQAGRALFRGNTPRIALAALIAVALVALVAIAFARCGKDTPENEAAPAVGTAARVSFVAVGDNLPEARITAYADALAGTTGDGDFDFSPPSTSRSSRSSRQPTSLTSNRKPISAARR